MNRNGMHKPCVREEAACGAADAELAGEHKQEADAGSHSSARSCCELGQGLILAPGQPLGPLSKSSTSRGSPRQLPG